MRIDPLTGQYRRDTFKEVYGRTPRDAEELRRFQVSQQPYRLGAGPRHHPDARVTTEGGVQVCTLNGVRWHWKP